MELKTASMSKTCWILGNVVYMCTIQAYIFKRRGGCMLMLKLGWEDAKKYFFLLSVKIS